MGDELNMPLALVPNDQLADETIRRARLVVAGRARDIDDARELLDALGLLDDNHLMRISDRV